MTPTWTRRWALGAILLAGATAAGAQTTTQPKPRKTYHVVRKGQTLYSIARGYGVPLDLLAQANSITNPSRIRAGRRLVIPGTASRPEIAIPAPEMPESRIEERLPWPVRGPVISTFDRPRAGHRHQGIDIGCSEGTPIHAVAGGVVVMSEEHYGRYGRLVAIDHEDGLVSYYGHNLRNLVDRGERVEAGEIIGLAGHSGNASCDHVHFELRRDGAPFDPETALRRTPSPPGPAQTSATEAASTRQERGPR